MRRIYARQHRWCIPANSCAAAITAASARSSPTPRVFYHGQYRAPPMPCDRPRAFSQSVRGISHRSVAQSLHPPAPSYRLSTFTSIHDHNVPKVRSDRDVPASYQILPPHFSTRDGGILTLGSTPTLRSRNRHARENGFGNHCAQWKAKQANSAYLHALHTRKRPCWAWNLPWLFRQRGDGSQAVNCYDKIDSNCDANLSRLPTGARAEILKVFWVE